MSPIFPQGLLDLHDELIVDLFAGGGGASCGIELATGRQVDVAINHDAAAVALHQANHPHTKHHVCDVFEADPRTVTSGRPVGLLWASPDCFPAGTLILTSRGYRPIEEIEVGELVLTHEGRYRQVTETMAARRPLVTVRGQGHPGISVSPEHPFYTRAAHNVWNAAAHHYDRTLGTPTWTKAADLRTAGAPMNAAGGDLSFWATPCWFPALPVPPVGGRGMEIDTGLLYLAGRYLGDGWTRLTDTRAELVITCSKEEAEDFGLWARHTWRRQGDRSAFNELAWHERPTDTAYQFSTNHRGLVEWLRSEFGHGAASKSIPAWALGLSSTEKEMLLQGYLSADGHTRQVSGSDVVYCTTVSKALAFSLRALAESLGYSVNVNGPYENRSEIEGRQVNAAPVWVVKWRRGLQRAQNVREGFHNWTRVRAVESEDRVATVYNLSVEEDESYVAEGIVVHNCTFHSKARGGKPFRDGARKRRALAWVVTRWAGQVRPRVIMLENVEEFADWGPLVGPPEAQRPCPRRKGQTFRKWVRSLERLGYVVEWRELRACDYGAPTIRKRLFLIARCDAQPIVWPAPTHGKGKGLKPFRTAAECIDWTIPMCSIFATKEEAKAWGAIHGQAAPVRPLAEATMRRIARGVMRYVVNNPKPFIVGVGGRQGQSPERPIDSPMQTITAKGDSAIVAPVFTEHANASQQRTFAPDEPLRTQVATVKGGHFSVVAPYLVPRYGERDGQEPRTRSVEEPAPVVVPSGNGASLVAAHLQRDFGRSVGQDAGEPTATITAGGSGKVSLVASFLAKHFTGVDGAELTQPAPTITTIDHNGLVAASVDRFAISCNCGHHFAGTLADPCPECGEITSGYTNKLSAGALAKLRGTSSAADPSDPLHTISAGGEHHAAVAAFLAKYYGTGDGAEVSDPSPTITTKDRFGLVTVQVQGEPYVIADIAMRMLQPRELYRAQGFPDSYVIDRGADGRKLTKTEQVRMVGNSVVPQLAAALARANVPEMIARDEARRIA